MKVAIVGAGILGRLLALELHDRGMDVTLFEKGRSNGSSACGYVGLGMIAPWSEWPFYPPGDLIPFHLGHASLPLWEKIGVKLCVRFDYLKKGVILLARHEELGLINDFKKRIKSAPVHSQWAPLSADNIEALEPEISSHFPSGVFLPEEGCLSSRDFFVATNKYFRAIGLSFHSLCGACDILPASKGKSVLFAPNVTPSKQTFDFIVDTRGLGAKTKENGLRGVRGETLDVLAPQVQLSRCVRVMDSKFPLYILPRGNGIYSLGATCLESEDEGPISVRTTLEILSMARFVHEGFMEGKILSSATQLRPAFPHNSPEIIMGKNHMRVNGLYRHGILCAPALAQLCAHLLAPKVHGDEVWSALKHQVKGMIREN
jgi:glycine oxidase